jgi:hypothetical protein
MKMMRREFVREVPISAAVGWWNQWDHEHSMVVHGESWLDGHMLYEDERTALAFVTIRVPVFSFLRSSAMNVNLKYDANTMYTSGCSASRPSPRSSSTRTGPTTSSIARPTRSSCAARGGFWRRYCR